MKDVEFLSTNFLVSFRTPFSRYTKSIQFFVYFETCLRKYIKILVETNFISFVFYLFYFKHSKNVVFSYTLCQFLIQYKVFLCFLSTNSLCFISSEKCFLVSIVFFNLKSKLVFYFFIFQTNYLFLIKPRIFYILINSSYLNILLCLLPRSLQII